jgi:uncharacterized damage-inducible protein DinB
MTTRSACTRPLANARLPIVLALLLGGAAQLPAQSSAFKDEGVERIETLREKFLSLAEAMPERAYTWRPADGVRSVSEVYLHVAAVNYGLTQVFGLAPPEDFNFRGYEKSSTDRERIIEELDKSFAHFQRAIEALPADAAGKGVKMFGRETTTRGAMWSALEHLSEHLGQSIAYARSNDVVPPWTAARGE